MSLSSSNIPDRVRQSRHGELSTRLARRQYDVAQMRRLARFAKWMDAKYQLPGVPIRFGVDSLIGLVPGVGDLVGTLIGVYILREAHSAGAPKVMLARMSGNLLIDFIGGSVPLVGDLFDIYWKANIRNVQLLEKHVSANLKKTQ